MIKPENIPAEIKGFPQWVCWQYEDRGKDKPTKVPYSPIRGTHAKVNDSSTWGTFAEACNDAHKYDGIGFVFTKTDPFVFIDLDDTHGDEVAYARQKKIYSEFDCYTEYSPSGTGVHIICKGAVPSGRKRSRIELYSDLRFATFTGNVLNDKPMGYRHELANVLWAQLGGISTNVVNGEEPQTESDEDVIARAAQASNGEKFQQLANGTWQNLYSSQSEADFAFVDIVAFYTQNREQVTRIFRNSPLGSRAKAKRNDYVNWMINRSFDHILPPIDTDGLKLQMEEYLANAERHGIEQASQQLVASITPPIESEFKFEGKDSPYDFPPGLVGEIANYILAQAPRPVREVALAASISLMAGIVGKSYNVSNTGLNQYTLFLGSTGCGKEAGPSGIHKLIRAVKDAGVPSAGEFLGPDVIASAAALTKFIAAHPCFVSIVGEFGLQIGQLGDIRNPHAAGLLRLFLHLYNKSGKGNELSQMIYSDKASNTSIVFAPAFSLYGESTPETFYGMLDESSITNGLLPRFTIIEYSGPRPPPSDTYANVKPSGELVGSLSTLITGCLNSQLQQSVTTIPLTEEAEDFTDKYNKFCDEKINTGNKEITKNLWNRAHLRVLKLAALVAVGISYDSPVVTLKCVQWAEKIVTSNVLKLLDRFQSGDVGEYVQAVRQVSESDQMAELTRIVKVYCVDPKAVRRKYENPDKMVEDSVIPYGYLMRRLSSSNAFRKDRMGATNAIKRIIQTAIETDVIREMSKADVANKYNTTQRCFMVSNMAILK